MLINTYWDGTPCDDPILHGTVDIAKVARGLRVTATLPHQAAPRVPDAPAGTRVANLWEYDVVECFLVGAHKYLEIELGAGGNFLLLDFTAPRVRDREYEHVIPELGYEKDAGNGRWRASLVVPWDMVPEGLKAMNAFVIVGDHYLCMSPLPGAQPDFHQPDRFLPFAL